MPVSRKTSIETNIPVCKPGAGLSASASILRTENKREPSSSLIAKFAAAALRSLVLCSLDHIMPIGLQNN